MPIAYIFVTHFKPVDTSQPFPYHCTMKIINIKACDQIKLTLPDGQQILIHITPINKTRAKAAIAAPEDVKIERIRLISDNKFPAEPE